MGRAKIQTSVIMFNPEVTVRSCVSGGRGKRGLGGASPCTILTVEKGCRVDATARDRERRIVSLVEWPALPQRARDGDHVEDDVEGDGHVT